MNVDIYLREKVGTREIRFPILPEEFTFSNGDAIFSTWDVIGRGEIVKPMGFEIGHYSWESEFPGINRSKDPMIRGSWKDPSSYISLLETWKKTGRYLNLLVTGYPVNVEVYIKEFTPKGTGAFGDVEYEIQLVQVRSTKIRYQTATAIAACKRMITGIPTINFACFVL